MLINLATLSVIVVVPFATPLPELQAHVHAAHGHPAPPEGCSTFAVPLVVFASSSTVALAGPVPVAANAFGRLPEPAQEPC